MDGKFVVPYIGMRSRNESISCSIDKTVVASMQVLNMLPHVVSIVTLTCDEARYAVHPALCVLILRPPTLAGLEELTETHAPADGPGSFLIWWRELCRAPE